MHLRWLTIIPLKNYRHLLLAGPQPFPLLPQSQTGCCSPLNGCIFLKHNCFKTLFWNARLQFQWKDVLFKLAGKFAPSHCHSLTHPWSQTIKWNPWADAFSYVVWPKWLDFFIVNIHQIWGKFLYPAMQQSRKSRARRQPLQGLPEDQTWNSLPMSGPSHYIRATKNTIFQRFAVKNSGVSWMKI